MLFEIKSENMQVGGVPSDGFPYHVHHNVEFVVCTEGTLQVSCNNTEKQLHRGDVAIFFSNDIHSYKETAFGKGIMVIFNPQISPLIEKTLRKTVYRNFVSNSDVVPIAQEMFNRSEQSARQIILCGYLHIIVGMILEEVGGEQKPVDMDTLGKAIQYISANYTQNITLSSVAAAVGVTQSHLSRLFSAKIEGGFKRYLQILRVQKAKNLLSSTDLSVNEVLEQSGFFDQRTFNRVFKAVTDFTPLAYRKLAQKS